MTQARTASFSPPFCQQNGDFRSLPASANRPDKSIVKKSGLHPGAGDPCRGGPGLGSTPGRICASGRARHDNGGRSRRPASARWDHAGGLRADAEGGDGIAARGLSWGRGVDGDVGDAPSIDDGQGPGLELGRADPVHGGPRGFVMIGRRSGPDGWIGATIGPSCHNLRWDHGRLSGEGRVLMPEFGVFWQARVTELPAKGRCGDFQKIQPRTLPKWKGERRRRWPRRQAE